MALHSAVLAALVLAFLCYRYVIYPAFLSPLCKIPTPHPIASILPVWLWWKERNKCQARSLADAHERKGPVIRVEPNHVHVNSLDGLRVVYHVGRFNRTDHYLQFRSYNHTPALFTMLDSKSHAIRRRIMSHVFSKSYILSSIDFQRLSHVVLFDRLLPVFEEAAETAQGVDMFEMAQALALEFMAAYDVGTGNDLDLIRKGTSRKRKAYLEAGKIKILELKGCKEATKFLEDRNDEMCKKAEEFLTSAKETDAHDESVESASTYPVVYALLRDSIPKKEGPKTQDEFLRLVASEVLDNVEAARFGIGGALTYILHEITLRPAIQSALRVELMALEEPLSHPPGQNYGISKSTLQKLDGLPLLDAVIMESLRLRNPIRMPAFRTVPQGGAVINGFFLPGGTVVSASTYALHMNPEAFPEPHKWVPERWLNLPDEKVPGASDGGEAEKGRDTKDPRRWFWTFISGSNMCLGNNFAVVGKSRNDAACPTNELM
jgi:cytochrome P450